MQTVAALYPTGILTFTMIPECSCRIQLPIWGPWRCPCFGRHSPRAGSRPNQRSGPVPKLWAGRFAVIPDQQIQITAGQSGLRTAVG